MSVVPKLQPGCGRLFRETTGICSPEHIPADREADGLQRILVDLRRIGLKGAVALGTGRQAFFLTGPSSVSILHHMAKFQGSQLDRTFAALVDPTRRAILARLEQEKSASIGELARPLAIKLPAVMKHLDVLGTAGLITRSKKGRIVTVRLVP